MERLKKESSRDLVSKAIGGDAEAFEALYRQYTSAIIYQTRRYISNHEDADDAAQEAVMEMYRNIGKLKSPDAFVPWMYQLTRFVCLKHLRHMGTAGRGQYHEVDIDEFSETLADEHGGQDPAQQAEDGERNAQIMRTIEKLPEKQREALVLYYYEGLNYREIAAAIGGTTSTVSTNIMKAKKNIAKNLEPAIAVAIAADANAKLAGVDFAAFWHGCNAGIAKLGAAGAGAHGAPPQGSKNTQAKQVALASLAAAVLIAIVALADAAHAPPPDVPEPAEAPPPAPAVLEPAPVVSVPAPKPEPFVPTAEIMFDGGDCDCGHVNPASAWLELSQSEGLVESWAIMAEGGAELFSGDGTVAPIGELLGGADGDYAVWFAVSNEAGAQATLSRSFLILGELEPGVIYQ